MSNKINTTKPAFIRLYFCFLNIQQVFKKQILNLETELNNIYIFLTFTLFIYEIFQITGNPNSQPIQLITDKFKLLNHSLQLEKSQIGLNQNFENTLILKQIKLTSRDYTIPSKLSKPKTLRFINNAKLQEHNIQKISPNIHLIKYSIQLPLNPNKFFNFQFRFTQTNPRSAKTPNFIHLIHLKLPIEFNRQSCVINKMQLDKRHTLQTEFFNRKIHLNKNGQIKLKITHTPPVNTVKLFRFPTSNWAQNRPIRTFSNSLFVKKNNILVKKSITVFSDLYEPISVKSYLIFLSLGFIFVFIKIFQNLYKEYGKEILIIFFDLLQLVGILDEDEWLKEDLQLQTEKTNFRSIRKVHCNLHEIAGIESIIVEISEIVWFLRTKHQTIFNPFQYILQLTKTYTSPFAISHSYLFIGPPGTGKTLLVQAIAGESGVPILIQAGSILKSPRQHGKGAQTLQLLFQRAHRISPCIVFIDEIDGLGARRENISLTSSGEYDFMELIDNQLNAALNQTEKNESINVNADEFNQEDNFWNIEEEKQKISLNVLQETERENISRTEKLTILTQLLIELDGLRPLNNIMVIGATNRHTVLDPALLRPGRFNNFLYVNIPNLKKRIDLFKMSIKKVGYESTILWSYLAKRTEGLSAATITSIINESALISIRQNKLHTLESIEQGILRITTLPNRQISLFFEKENILIKQIYNELYHFFIDQTNGYNSSIVNIHQFKLQKTLNLHLSNCYYRASKNLFSLFFQYMPSECLLSFTDRKKNFRYQKLNNIIETLENQLNYKKQLESKLIFLLAGKATEMLANQVVLPKNQYTLKSQKFTFQLLELTNFSSNDLKQATLLVRYMVSKWYLYTEQVITEKYHKIETKHDLIEYDVEELRLMKAVAEDINSQISSNTDKRIGQTHQKRLSNPWWQRNIQQQLNFVESNSFEWYRIYLSDPEDSEQNIEWVPPDSFYYEIQEECTNPYFAWNQILLSTQNYLWNSLMLNTFNTAFHIMKNSVELLDLIINQLLINSKIREDELIKIINKFYINFYHKKDYTQTDEFKKTKISDCITIRKSWGKNSRRPVDKKIFINKIQQYKSSD